MSLSHLSVEQLEAEIARRKQVADRLAKDPKPKRPSAPKKPIKRVVDRVIPLNTAYSDTLSMKLADILTLLAAEQAGPNQASLNISLDWYDYDGARPVVNLIIRPSDEEIGRVNSENAAAMVEYDRKMVDYRIRHEAWKQEMAAWRKRNE